MSEREGYREILADILAFFNGKRLLTKRDVAQYCGIDVRTAEKRFAIKREGIAAPMLARKMCQ